MENFSPIQCQDPEKFKFEAEKSINKFVHTASPTDPPPILLFEAWLLYESCKPLTCVSTRFCLFLMYFACRRGHLKWKFFIFVKTAQLSKSSRPDFLDSYPMEWPLALRKFRSYIYLCHVLISSRSDTQIARNPQLKARSAINNFAHNGRPADHPPILLLRCMAALRVM